MEGQKYEDEIVEVYEVGSENVGDEQLRKPKSVEYSVGEICKCYYNIVSKFDLNSIITQTQSKCQGYCKVLEKHPDSQREYTVEVLQPVGDKIKRLPGCCLRKVKFEPYGLKEAIDLIGSVVKTKDGLEYMEIVTVCEDGGNVRINDIDAKVFMNEYVHITSGYPCGKIVMMKADEIFGDGNRTQNVLNGLDRP